MVQCLNLWSSLIERVSKNLVDCVVLVGACFLVFSCGVSDDDKNGGDVSGPANNEDSLSDQGDNPRQSTAAKFAIWKGVDKHPRDPRPMAMLNANAGQLGMSDGSAGQSNDADLRQKVQWHHNEEGGMYKGSPSGFLDTPND